MDWLLQYQRKRSLINWTKVGGSGDGESRLDFMSVWNVRERHLVAQLRLGFEPSGKSLSRLSLGLVMSDTRTLTQPHIISTC